MQRLLAAALALSLLCAAPARAEDDPDLAAYAKAIAWLAKQQHENGAFGAIPRQQEQGELGMTGLALSALAGAPEPYRTTYRPQADKAAAWILAHQQPDGSFVQARSGMATYRTSIAILALVRYDRERYREQIKKAAEWLKASQWSEQNGAPKEDPNHGGFGYGGGKRPSSDLSNTNLALAALHDAGIAKDDPVFQRALVFLSRCQNSSETNPGVKGVKPTEDGGFHYAAAPGRDGVDNGDGTKSFASYASMTYGGLMSLVESGLDRKDPRVKAALGWIEQHYTLDENYGLGTRSRDPKAGQKGLYYYYFVFAKCLATLGSPALEAKGGERKWARDLLDALRKRQQPDGRFVNTDPAYWENDPVLVTSFVLDAMNRALPFRN
ncbi:MAG: prenyltransferase/squalene oxidase repeat-containing protein [Planctomycetota bacterium]